MLLKSQCSFVSASPINIRAQSEGETRPPPASSGEKCVNITETKCSIPLLHLYLHNRVRVWRYIDSDFISIYYQPVMKLGYITDMNIIYTAIPGPAFELTLCSTYPPSVSLLKSSRKNIWLYEAIHRCKTKMLIWYFSPINIFQKKGFDYFLGYFCVKLFVWMFTLHSFSEKKSFSVLHL